MKNIEYKKFKNLKINLLFLIMFLAHVFIVLYSGLSKSFVENKLPIYFLIDNFIIFSLIFNPILISSLVKRTIEIEEKNNMWQVQLSFGEKINNILFNKIKIISRKLIGLLIIEFILILFLARNSNFFLIDSEIIIRLILLFFTILFINLFLLVLFTILEMKVGQVYFTSFLSIVGSFTGIICMLTSKILCFINPFAWPASLLNISFIRENDKFIQVLNPGQYITILIAFISLVLGIIYLKNMKKFKLKKEF